MYSDVCPYVNETDGTLTILCQTHAEERGVYWQVPDPQDYLINIDFKDDESDTVPICLLEMENCNPLSLLTHSSTCRKKKC